MTDPEEWRKWSDVWQERAADEASLERALVHARRARRLHAMMGAAETALVVVAVTGLAAALRHAANAVEAVLGASVAVAILATWIVQMVGRRHEARSTVATSTAYVTSLQRLHRRTLGFVRFVWVVLALEGLFLAKWWIGGISEHQGELGSRIAILSLWSPLVAISALIAWTFRLHRRTRRGVEQLERVQTELGA